MSLRITYVGPLPPLRGGIPQHGARLVEALVRQGHEVSVESWDALYPRRLYPVAPVTAEERAAPGYTLPPGRVRDSLHWAKPWSWWAAGRRAGGGDLIVFPWWVPAQAPAVRTFLSAAGRVPRVGVIHDVVLPKRHRADRRLAHLALRPLTGAVVHNDHVRTQLRQLLPDLPTDRIVTVDHPPNQPLTPQPLPDRPPLELLLFGHVRSYKGLDHVLDAMALGDGAGLDTRLTVAGQFWQPIEPWQQRIDAMGLGDRVTLRPGYVPDADLPDLFAAHHLVLTPYSTASQSGVIPLATAAGRPSVVTPVGGLADQITDGVDGTVAADLSAAALADAIARADADLERLAEGTRRARATWDDVAAAVVEAADLAEVSGATTRAHP